MCKNTTVINLTESLKIDLVGVVYYMKQVFHLHYDRSVTRAEALLCFSFIFIIVV